MRRTSDDQISTTIGQKGEIFRWFLNKLESIPEFFLPLTLQLLINVFLRGTKHLLAWIDTMNVVELDEIYSRLSWLHQAMVRKQQLEANIDAPVPHPRSTARSHRCLGPWPRNFVFDAPPCSW